ncbi:O-antigen ligase, partial [Eubacterium sp.]|uniref:O-antigen ligase family protein n=1 Tax=Eubacterium sp. TaxID=142586 RepID=UPI0026E019AB
MKRFKEILRDPLSLLLFILPFIFGLYYEFAAYLAGGALALCLAARIRKKKEIYLSKAVPPILLGAACLCCLFTVFYGVDKGMAAAGFFKVLPIPLFLLLIMQYSEKERLKLLEVVPYSALVMTVLSAVLGLSEAFSAVFYSAGRLGGFFQYSNTFAFYLLLGCVVLLSVNTTFDKRFQIGGTAILLAGILLTGSRSVFVLTVLTFGYFILRQKERRIPLLILSGSLIISAVIFAFATGHVENISRFLTINMGESTFLGRVLYWKDGIGQILQHPFGLGYMGYFYTQPSFQTGVYTVRYI